MVEQAAQGENNSLKIHEVTVSSLTSICPESWSFSSWGLNIRSGVKLLQPIMLAHIRGRVPAATMVQPSFTQCVEIVALSVISLISGFDYLSELLQYVVDIKR